MEAVAQLREQWSGLRSHVEGLQHVERYSVVSVAYRRWAGMMNPLSILPIPEHCTPDPPSLVTYKFLML